jgi:hypothetical protein
VENIGPSRIPGRARQRFSFNLFRKGQDFKGCGKNSPLHLILGGAALQRCGKSFALNPASAAEVMPAAFVAVFPQPLQSCRNCFVIVAALAAGGNASFQIVPRPRRGNGGKRFSSVLLSASVNEFPMNQFPMTV